MPMPRNPKYDKAAQMYLDGKTVKELAEIFGITVQVMGDNLRRRGIVLRGDFPSGKDNHMYRGTRAHRAAQKLVELRLRQGRIVRPDSCEECGDGGLNKGGKSKIQAHHCDYNKPLDVMWLCRKCHYEWHKNNIPIAKVFA